VTTFSTYKKSLYATPIDVRIMSLDFLREFTHSNTIFLDDPRISMALLRARGIVDLKLGGIVSGTTTFETTPYISSTLTPAADENDEGENETTSGTLLGIIPSADALTELWTFEFSDADTYTITGSMSGVQGGGDTTSVTPIVSTNTHITVPIDAWSGTFVAGDKFYIPVYRHIPEIVLLSTMLATGLIYKGSAAGNAPGDNPAGAKLYDDAIKLLDSIANGNSGLMGISFELDTTDLQTIYEISPWGYDVSAYSTDERNKYATESFHNRPWWAM
jgi:hypothetical protein